MPTTSGYVTANQILSDVVMLLGEEEPRELSYGYYISQVQQAISELAFDTYFDDKVWILDIVCSASGNHGPMATLPEGVWSIDGIFAFNGDSCGAGDGVKVYWARNMTRYGGGTFKHQQGENHAPHLTDNVMSKSSRSDILYAGLLDNVLMLSDSCAAYAKLLIQGKGMGCKVGDAPVIPHELREAVKNYVLLKAGLVMVQKGKLAPAMYAEIKRAHFGGNGTFDVGSWKQAQRRVQAMHGTQLEDLRHYLSNLDLKTL